MFHCFRHVTVRFSGRARRPAVAARSRRVLLLMAALLLAVTVFPTAKVIADAPVTVRLMREYTAIWNCVHSGKDIRVELIPEREFYRSIETGPTEAYDMQIVPLRGTRSDLRWLPLFTVAGGYGVRPVLLTDDAPGDKLSGDTIEDLRVALKNHYRLYLSEDIVERRLAFASFVYALDKDLDPDAALRLLREFRTRHLLTKDINDADIVLCLSDAPEVIPQLPQDTGMPPRFAFCVPREGALTYRKGLVGIDSAKWPGRAAIERFRDNTCGCFRSNYSARDSLVSAESYGAEKIINLGERYVRLTRTRVFHTRTYTSKDNISHVFLALAVIFVIIVWTGRAIAQIFEDDLRKAILTVSILLIAWIVARIFKYQVYSLVPNLFLWWSYYVFQLALPVVLLWIALQIDRDEKKFPIPWVIATGVNVFFALMTITNYWHGRVVRIKLTQTASGYAQSDYTYGWAFYALTAVAYVEMLVVIWLLYSKHKRAPRIRTGTVIATVIGLLSIVYMVGYILRIPIFWESDYTVVSAALILLFLESLMRGGLIPVHRRYFNLFRISDLKMQIHDDDGRLILASATAEPLPETLWDRFEAFDFQPTPKDDRVMMHASKIAGGRFIWEEDLTDLIEQEDEIRRRGTELLKTTALLREESRIREEMLSTLVKNEMISKLQNEIFDGIDDLKTRIRELEGSTGADRERQTAELAVLLSYLKRRCHFFFHEVERDVISAEELYIYLDELGEIAAYAGVDVVTASALEGNVAVDQATLAYDFLYRFINLAEQYEPDERSRILCYLQSEGDTFVLRILTSFRVPLSEALLPRHYQRIATSRATVSYRDMDDMASWQLIFTRAEENRRNGV